MTPRPFEFTGAYANCYINPDVAMDQRHVFILYEILSSWPFKSALELGSFWGASSTAFVEAINSGSEMTATFCDINVSNGLRSVMSNCKHQDRVRLAANLSSHVLSSADPFDFVLVDAFHDTASVTPELEQLMIRKPLCVMAHDTNATAAKYPHAEGAEMLKRAFEDLPEYHCFEDCERRAGERTERGLFLATTDVRLFRVACGAFGKWTA